jgi:uncharacterized protein (TIGR03437 family)
MQKGSGKPHGRLAHWMPVEMAYGEKTALLRTVGLIALTVPSIFAQDSSAPAISGIVNAASYSSPVGPGSLVAIFGSNLEVGTTPAQASSTPLPTMLAGTTVTFNDTKAALLFVSPGQINAQVPSTITSNGGSASTVSVVVSTSAGSSADSQVSVFSVGPGLFTSDASGCGAAAALNVASDGSVSVNSSSNSAAPGDYISLYGTGLGIPSVVPSDGTALSTADSFTSTGLVHLDYSTSGVVPSYSGLAPTLVGVDQVNFQIPTDTREGCAVPISMEADAKLLSPLVTISISKSRGQCVDPPTQSYGEVWLEKTVASGTSNDGEVDQFNAVFPAGPGLKMPALQVMSPGTNSYNFTTPAASTKSCAVAGYSQLSAGTISIQSSAPGTSVVTAAPTVQGSNVEYRQSLPTGFVQAGQYTLSSQAKAPTAVQFQQPLSVGSEIKIQTPLTAGTTLSASTNKTIAWTGGDPTSLIRVTLIDDVTQIASPKDVWYASAADGSITLSNCTGGVGGSPIVCTYGLAPSKNAQLTVDVLPANGVADTVANVHGISQQARFSWAYHYVFGGLTITN